MAEQYVLTTMAEQYILTTMAEQYILEKQQWLDNIF